MDNKTIKSKTEEIKMEEQEFKIGDKVKVIGEVLPYNVRLGEIGTVCGFAKDSDIIGVELEIQCNDRHSCWGRCREKHGQWIRREYLKKITGKKNNEQKIVITTDGTTTTAKLYEDGRIAKTATAKRQPKDKFNFNTGAKYAFERLLGDVYPPEEPNKVKAAQPKFKVGDKVKVIRNITDMAVKNDYIGKAYTIREVYGKDMYPKGVAYSIGESFVVYESEIELAPQLYNGKVVCVEAGAQNAKLYTKGKIYQFADGVITADNGSTFRNYGKGYKSFEDFAAFSNSKFIEIKE